ncbi:hypothetical protein KC19_9G137500 [Ceratodon purpureus]|uniref:ACB domain-containing protein n=1 Tax=Ceratodon purpureus TaxID=3225 RepID=A0A8T0GX66_CERPU|nr:hypothetical protein KC19_9G137500 [Ceratodon purpureus]
MADWQERVQSMIIGFVFAYMVMKLFSVIANFRAGNLRVERASDEDEALLVPAGEEPVVGTVGTDEEAEADGGDEQGEESSSSSSSDEEGDDIVAKAVSRELEGTSGVESKGEEVEVKEEEGVEKKDVGASDEPSVKAVSKEAGGDFEEESEDENEIDDWEGVESTELEKLFGAASTYADTMVTLPGVNSSSEAMLQLHAFYKIATEGPCSSSQPTAFQPTARAKWNAWQKLGNMSQEEAMQKYIAVLTEINPTWHEDYQKSKEPAKEVTQQNQGDLSPSSDKIDASPVLIELVTSGEEDLPKYVSSEAFHTIIFLFARNCCFMTRINVQTILFLAIPSRLDMTFKNLIRSFAIL